MTRNCSRFFLLLSLPLYASVAQAGASLLVDSATITAAGHCQVESWVRMHSPE
ncbi:hypothetical protein [Hydrogenophaga sp.]|uniref:hypothetical protein n=1 Tax=Hydrogenophaga sp. TaxID=1904254 RepID=UPI0025BD8CF2|nr:hypothetical protein [Hydrogenophaga sp.]